MKKKGKVVLGNDLELQKELTSVYHDSGLGGHSGVHATTKRIAVIFYRKGMKKAIREYIR